MTYDFDSRSGGRGSYRGRGRGSDSYGSRGFSGRGSYRGSGGYRGRSNYRGNNFDPRKAGGRFEGDRYHSSRERGGGGHDSSFERRDFHKGSPSSFDRGYRGDAEPDRKRPRQEFNSYREGSSSSRRSCDGGSSFEERSPYSQRGGRSSGFSRGRPYEYSSGGRSGEYSPFKRPESRQMSPSHRSDDYRSSYRGSRRPMGSSSVSRISRGSRIVRGGRISSYATTARRGRLGVSRVPSKILTLRREKILRMQRLRRERELARRHVSENEKQESPVNDGENENLSDDEVVEEEEVEVEVDEDVEQKEDKSDKDESGEEKEEGEVQEKKKVVKKVVKKVKKPVKKIETAEEKTTKERQSESVPLHPHREHVTLKCIHCKEELETFRGYQLHLASGKHKHTMINLLKDLKQKLRNLRMEQREHQRKLDDSADEFMHTSYCKLCKLNFRQTYAEHSMSDFHIKLNEFLRPRCSLCRIRFRTPLEYEQHRCNLSHLKRMAFLKHRGVKVSEHDGEDETEDSKFMVLDSVGSADEEEFAAGDDSGKAAREEKKKAVKKRSLTKLVGIEFVKTISVYYCSLCRISLPCSPNVDQDEALIQHCRSIHHLKQYSFYQSQHSEDTEEQDHSDEKDTVAPKVEPKDEPFSEAGPEMEVDSPHKMSDEEEEEEEEEEDEDEDKSDNRYDRFGNREMTEDITEHHEVGVSNGQPNSTGVADA